MNYLTHYFYNRSVANHEFHIGVAVPDMLSSFNRKARPNFDRAREFVGTKGSVRETSFWEGVINHEYGDQIFHSSHYFKHFTGQIKQHYRSRTFPGIRVRSWFLAHITLEIVLDHALIKIDPELVDDFYLSFDRCSNNIISENTVSILHEQRLGQGFQDYVRRFKSTRFLQHYRHLDGITEAVNRVCLRARQDPFEGKNRMALTELLEQCLETLTIPSTLEELGAWKKD